MRMTGVTFRYCVGFLERDSHTTTFFKTCDIALLSSCFKLDHLMKDDILYWFFYFGENEQGHCLHQCTSPVLQKPTTVASCHLYASYAK